MPPAHHPRRYSIVCNMCVIQVGICSVDCGTDIRSVLASGSHSIWDPQGVETMAAERPALSLPDSHRLLGTDGPSHNKIACMGLAWSHCVNTRILMTRERSAGSAMLHPSVAEDSEGYRSSERLMACDPSGVNHVSQGEFGEI